MPAPTMTISSLQTSVFWALVIVDKELVLAVSRSRRQNRL
uniref:Uncharacterized protein n=1 Tax=Rhizophora mucronata TaxID=61149 RepID=A0A2P2K8D1_RHIMU